MTQKNLKNITASVRHRLVNKARNDHRPFAELLQYYAMERFLYRLSISEYKEYFILKCALMLRAWEAPMARPTRDIDLLGKFDNDVETITQLIKDICILDSPIDDGVNFDTDSLKGILIKEDADYEGVRVVFIAYLGTARVNMQIDIGFSDAVFPQPKIATYPTLLDFPAPTLLSYRMETTIAEKFEAMVHLGILNSRMKDFYDIWLLARQFKFDGAVLQQAISKTFSKRNMRITPEIEAFSDEFAIEKAIQWTAFRNKLKMESIPAEIQTVVAVLQTFLLPIMKACSQKETYTKKWIPESDWQDQ